MECIDVTLDHVCFHKVSQYNKAGIPFLIGKTDSGQTIKGEMLRPSVGARYRLWGEWRPQKGYNAPAFEFVTHDEVVVETASGFSQYLFNNVDGLGRVKSRAIVDAFGSDVLKVLRETPEKAAEVKGITPEIVDAIREHFGKANLIDPMAYAQVVEMFAGHRISKRIVKAVLDDWGSNAPQMLRDRPYLLLDYPGMGWKTVDAFARATAEYPANGIDRHKAAIVEATARIIGEGHTFATQSEIETTAYSLISARPTDQAWQAALYEGELTTRDDDGVEEVYTLSRLAEAEESIATRLAILAASAAPLPFPLDDDGLLPGQQQALRLIEQHGVVILAGAPGTGKTYTIAKTLTGLVKQSVQSMQVATPTGKAAKRASELLQRALPDVKILTSTIHRALGPTPSKAPEGVPASDAKTNRGRPEFEFARNENNPLETEILVVDESSMADVPLFSKLLKATASGTRLIIVGDPNQLPSVGPGSVLRDAIAAGVPTATLTEVQRNCGTIVRACHSIMRGQTPVPAKRANLETGDNWIHVELSDPAAIAKRIAELHVAPTKLFEERWDRQVISPENGKASIGCNDLNRLLSIALNHKRNQPGLDKAQEGFTPTFVIGDKIVRTKNGLCDLMIPFRPDEEEDSYGFGKRPDWTWNGQGWELTETDLVNGDMGEIVDICEHKDRTYVVVDFKTPDRRCRLPFSDCHLIPAYAMTCHKAQGSGFPYVILPVHHLFYYKVDTGEGLWNREMIYTMFSRAEKLLVTVGLFSAIELAISRPSIGRRQTRLKGLIETSFPKFITQENLSHV